MNVETIGPANGSWLSHVHSIDNEINAARHAVLPASCPGYCTGDVFARVPVEMCYKLDESIDFLPVSGFIWGLYGLKRVVKPAVFKSIGIVYVRLMFWSAVDSNLMLATGVS